MTLFNITLSSDRVIVGVHCHVFGIWLRFNAPILASDFRLGFFLHSLPFLLVIDSEVAIMEEKEPDQGGYLLPVLVCCMLLACAGLVFAVYTHRELSLLKTQIREHEETIQTLQLCKSARDNQVGALFTHALLFDFFNKLTFYLLHVTT